MIPGAKKIPATVIKSRIWHQIKHRLTIEWEKQLQARVRSGKIDEYVAQTSFEFDFGVGTNIFEIRDSQISFALQPREPG